MKTILLFILALALPVAISFAADPTPKSGAKKTPNPAKEAGPIREITLEETDALMHKQADISLIDVRSPEELQALGHIKGAKNIDYLSATFDKEISALKLDQAKPCIVYCAVGGRAKRAADKMVKLGFKEILLPKGSFNAWKSAGKPVEGGSPK